MSSATIASTAATESRFRFSAASSEARKPVTTIASPSSAGAVSAAAFSAAASCAWAVPTAKTLSETADKNFVAFLLNSRDPDLIIPTSLPNDPGLIPVSF